MATRSVESWTGVIREKGNDMELAKFLLADLTGYRAGRWHSDDKQTVFNLLLALRAMKP